MCIGEGAKTLITNEEIRRIIAESDDMAESVRVSVKPEVFRWLRESSGWSVEELSKRLDTSVEIIEQIEKGEKDPTLRQLKTLSHVYKRPIALFFLSEPIPEPKMPSDYRMIPDKKDIFDKKTIRAIREARELQHKARELAKNLGEELEPKIKRASIRDDPRRLAVEYRELMGISEEIQKKANSAYRFFNILRERLEDRNILVFKRSMPVEDARGFVLADELPNVIVVSTSDRIEARIFTLMHEFAHLLLGETVIDLPGMENMKEKGEIERWCDMFSSEFLLPEDLAHKVFGTETRPLTDTKTMESLKRKYKVSKGMLAYNMLRLRYIDKKDYEEFTGRFKVPETGGGGGQTVEEKRISEMGEKYVSLVVHNYEMDYITYSEALNYLSVKSSKFDKVVEKAGK